MSEYDRYVIWCKRNNKIEIMSRKDFDFLLK